jgi:hypothetical protein
LTQSAHNPSKWNIIYCDLWNTTVVLSLRHVNMEETDRQTTRSTHTNAILATLTWWWLNTVLMQNSAYISRFLWQYVSKLLK